MWGRGLISIISLFSSCYIAAGNVFLQDEIERRWGSKMKLNGDGGPMMFLVPVERMSVLGVGGG